MSLPIRDRMTLELAGTPYRYMAIRETHARERLGLDPVTFWARVNMLIDDPRAEAEMPGVVRRLRRLRERRAQVRTTSQARR